MTLAWPISADGVLLTVTYARLQDFKNTDGELLTRAKWLRFQWDRSEGAKNRVFYGSYPYVVEGAFEIGDEITLLDTILR